MFYYFRPIFIIWKENHPHKTANSEVFLKLKPYVCQFIKSDVRNETLSELQNFSTLVRFFNISKISQKVQNLIFPKK